MNKHILITGGSRGIGAAAVRALAQKGARVSFFYKSNRAAAEQLTAELEAKGCTVRCYMVDVTDREMLLDGIRQCTDAFSDIDVLISNAGVASQCLITQMSEADFRQMMDTHITALFHLTQGILPGMIQRSSGVILAVSSIWGITGASCEVAYSTAKAAIIGYVKALAKEVGPSNIRVNCVAPGVIETDMLKDFSEEDKRALAEDTPLGRLGKPHEVADVLCYLASEEAGFITGQVISPNGGFLI